MNTPKERFEQQLYFLREVEKMKSILRMTILADGSKRRENDAEHSWHFALMAMIFYEYADSDHVDLNHVIRMALVHDLVEVYAGDTYAYDTKGYEDKLERETAAADKLFSLLPNGQGDDLRALWEEFEAMETPDALYAGAIDRLQPLLNNIYTEGYTWNPNHVTSAQVYARMEPVKTAMPKMWDYVKAMIEGCIEKGFLTR